MERAMDGYIVALRYTAAAGGYAGVVIWRRFQSKEIFDAWFNGGGNEEQEVVEEGICPERAIKLCEQTPLHSFITAAVQESTDPVTGRMNHRLVEDRLRQVARAYWGRS